MARTMSVPCRRDLTCYRNDGHDGDCAYPTPETALTPPPAEPAPKMMLNGKMNPDYLAWNERRKALPPAEPMLDVKLLRQEVGKQLTDARVDGWVRGMSVPLHGREVSVDLQSRYLAATIRAAVLNIIDPLPDAKEPQP